METPKIIETCSIREEPFSEGTSSYVYQIKKAEKNYALQVKKVKFLLKDNLRAEIEILKSLDHPNILQILQHSVDWNQYLTPFYSNLTIFEAIVDNLSSTNRGSVMKTIMLQIAQTVQYLHSKNIAHRDIKAENIFMDDDYNIIMGDFGFATANVDKMHQQKVQILGTNKCMAPQLYTSEFLDLFKVDVYALGFLFFEMTFGFPPFLNAQNSKHYFYFNENGEKYFTYLEKLYKIKFSPAQMSFFLNILTKNPDERMNIDQVLEHQFFEEEQILSQDQLKENYNKQPVTN